MRAEGQRALAAGVADLVAASKIRSFDSASTRLSVRLAVGRRGREPGYVRRRRDGKGDRAHPGDIEEA